MPARKPHKKTPTVLVILDGFGLAEPGPGNAITSETAPNIFAYMKKYPTSKLKAHGEAVGLFKNQEGNSEAGHMTIGAGRVVKQDAVVISDAIEDGTFFKNPALLQAMDHIKKNSRQTLHVMGLLTNGQSAHAHPEHLYAVLDLAFRKGIRDVAIHLFTDGRDSSPHGAVRHLYKLQKKMYPGQRIASVMGRFYAMDRNKVWARTKEAYNALVLCKGGTAISAEEAIAKAYDSGLTDEYIRPTLIISEDQSAQCIQDNDAVIFFNVRSDRARQLTKSFVQHDFEAKNGGTFKRQEVRKGVAFVAMSEFGPDLPGIVTAFPSADVPDCLAAAIGEDYTQLYISESEKFAHVTYFINGGYAQSINGEKREMIASLQKDDFTKHPGLKAEEIAKKVVSYVQKGTYDVISVNFPNADIIGHTGNVAAAKKAISIVDNAVVSIVNAAYKKGGTVLITGDHGNAEQMVNSKTKEVITEHSTNSVPFIVVDDSCKSKRIRKHGTLADIAPTMLKLLGKNIPKTMTGTSLL